MKKHDIDFSWLAEDVLEDLETEFKVLKKYFNQSINATIKSQASFVWDLFGQGVSCQFWLTEDGAMCEEKITFNQLFDDFFEWNEGDEDSSDKALVLKNQLLEQIKKIDEFIKKENK
jgi:hypothetical protein